MYTIVTRLSHFRKAVLRSDVELSAADWRALVEEFRQAVRAAALAAGNAGVS